MAWEEAQVLKIPSPVSAGEGAAPRGHPLLSISPLGVLLRVPVLKQDLSAGSAVLGEMGKGYKVVVCGMASVGKTAILEQLLYGKHTVGETFLPSFFFFFLVVSFSRVLLCAGPTKR